VKIVFAEIVEKKAVENFIFCFLNLRLFDDFEKQQAELYTFACAAKMS